MGDKERSLSIADVLAHLVENAHWAEGDLELARQAVNEIRPQGDNVSVPVPDAPQA